MGLVSNLRGSRTQEGLPLSDELPSSSSVSNNRKCSNLVPLVVALVVIAEISFLGRLDIAKNAAFSDSWADMFFKSHSSDGVAVAGDQNWVTEGCEEWLEREDAIVYSRDFSKDPIWVSGGEQERKTCDVSCKFGHNPSKKPDAAFGFPQESRVASILRSMESATYYRENSIAQARRRGYDIVMTTSLSSDVPVGYFSWAEYDIMAPVMPKTEKALAAAFISNCGAPNFRLGALVGLEKENITIDSYGGCHRNRNGQGTIPVVVGAPNIEDFAPSPSSFLHIKELTDVHSVAKRMKYLAENPDAYNRSLRWKYEGPSDSFKALLDMSAVHSSCRLCIHLATVIREKEEKSSDFKKRPCKCTRGSETVYHLYVRERGRFEMHSIFLRSDNLTLKALEAAVAMKFKSRKHVPIWKQERPESIRGGDELKVYRIYPVGLTQRQALYSFKFERNADLKSHIQTNPCAKFEVIFV